jgi:hypothetical protein
VIVLNTTSQSFRVAATDVSSARVYLTAVYFDTLPQSAETKERRTNQMTSTSSAAVVVAVSSAGVGMVRNIENFTAHNGTLTSATLDLGIVDGAVTTFQLKQTLTTGQSLVYEHGTGWQKL